MNDCSDPKTNDKFFNITKDFMSYFDQFYKKRVLDKFERLLNVSYWSYSYWLHVNQPVLIDPQLKGVMYCFCFI